MKKFVTAARWIVALVFLISGISKAVNAAQFTQTIVSYGFPKFQFLAPVIIMVEVLLALLLIFKIRTKWTALLGSVMIFGFTLLYTYAFVSKGITDCGCFGGLLAGFNALNNSPWFLYGKNAVLLALLVFIFLKAEDAVPHRLWIYAFIVASVGGVGFASGYTYDFEDYEKLAKPVAVKDSPLNEFVEVNPDSTYVVFAFSCTCPHCMNSVGNLNEYEALGVADRVVGLALGDSAAVDFFQHATRANFPITPHGRELLHLSRSFPRLYYIERDSIRMDIKGEVPAGFILKILVK